LYLKDLTMRTENFVKDQNLNNDFFDLKELVDLKERLIKNLEKTPFYIDHLAKTKYICKYVKTELEKDITKYNNQVSSKTDIYKRNLILTNDFEDILDLGMLIALVFTDLCVCINHYFNAKYKYEAMYSLRQINVIMIEGYKKIYGFNDKINNSLWISKIKPLVEKEYDQLNKEFNSILSDIQEIGSNGTLNNVFRNISIHYDIEPIKVYETFVNIKIEDVSSNFKNVIPYISLFGKMHHFMKQLISELTIKITECQKDIIESSSIYENRDIQ